MKKSIILLLVIITIIYCNVGVGAINNSPETKFSSVDVKEAERLSQKYDIPYNTILKLNYEILDWKTVEKGLREVAKVKKDFNKNKIKTNGIVQNLLDREFKVNEILVMIYYASINEVDLYQKRQYIPNREDSGLEEYCKDIYFDDSESTVVYETYSTTSTDSFLKYDADKSSPFNIILNNGTESINPATGSLILTQTDLSLPGKNGLDFNLTRVYRSEKAGISNVINRKTIPGNISDEIFHLGVGWSFDFPFIEIESLSRKYLHLGSEGTYLIDLESPTGLGRTVKTKEYTLEQMEDSPYYIILKHKSGVSYYFDRNRGTLVYIKNKFDDRIEFHYFADQISVIDPDTGDPETKTIYYIDSIVDSVGRIINFTYATNLVQVTVYNSDNPYIIKYYKSNINEDFMKLDKVELPEGMITKYNYSIEDLLHKYLGYIDLYKQVLNLKSVTHPYGSQTRYDYSIYNKHFAEGTAEGYVEYFRLVDRKEMYDFVYNKYQNHISYDYVNFDDEEHDYYYANIFYHGNYTDSFTKKEKFTFDEDYNNIKIETTYPDYPNLEEIITKSYTDNLLDGVICSKKDSSTGKSWCVSTYYEYDDYQNITKVWNTEGQFTENQYNTFEVNDTNNSKEVSSLKLVEKKSTNNYIFYQTSNDYSSSKNYNKSSRAERECIYTLVDNTRIIFNDGDDTVHDSSTIERLPENTKQVNVEVFWTAGLFNESITYELRIWEVGKENKEENYVYQRQYTHNNGGDTVVHPITIDDPTKAYYVEFKMTDWGLLSSAKVESISVLYENYARVLLDDVVLQNFYYEDSQKTHLPNRIITRYKKSPDSEDYIVEEYGYDENLMFPTSISKTFTDADGQEKILETTKTYDYLGRLTDVTYLKDLYDLNSGKEIYEKYNYDILGRIEKKEYGEIINGSNHDQYIQIYNYALEPDANGLYTTQISHPDRLSSDQDKFITTYYYNNLGQHVKTTKGPVYSEIVTEKYTYDGFGRTETVEDGEGIQQTLSYDPLGRPFKITQYDKYNTREGFIRKTYDDLNREITESIYESSGDYSYLVGQTTTYLDVKGNIIEVNNRIDPYNPNLIRTINEYNYAGQLKSTTDPRNLTLRFEHSYYGIEKTDYPGYQRNNDIIVYDYQGAERIVKELRDESNVVDSNSEFIKTHYDELDRVKKIEYPDGRVLESKYYSNGLPKTVTLNSSDTNSTITYSYDSIGNKTDVNHNYDTKLYSLSYTYNELGNVASITYPNGLVIEYEYDNYGRVIKIPGFVEKSGLAGVKYKDDGFLDRITYKNGVETDYIPDNMNRIAAIQSSVMDYRYQYDPKGNITRFAIHNPTSGARESDKVFRYNFMDWLINEVDVLNSTKKVYEYDLAGNRTKSYMTTESLILNPIELLNDPDDPTQSPPVYDPPKDEPIIVLPPTVPITIFSEPISDVENYEYNPLELNLLTSINGTSVEYDSWGNTVSNGSNGHNYVFNDSNQLTKVYSGSSLIGQYYYNSEGKRYKKIEDNTTTYYVYEGENLIYEEREDGTKICYIYLNNKPIGRIEENTLGIRKKYYYHTDHLGTTRVVTDSLGNKVASYDYDIFGFPIDATINESLAYTSKGQDATGLFYFNARYYDSILGRFISEDPVKDGANWYIYASNNPLKFIDPTGLETVLAIVGLPSHAGRNFEIAANTWIDENSISTDEKITIKASDYNNIRDLISAISDATGDAGIDKMAYFGHSYPGGLSVFYGNFDISNRWIDENTDWSNVTFTSESNIYLFGCNGGTGAQDSIAQILANQTGVTTYGYTSYTFFTDDPLLGHFERKPTDSDICRIVPDSNRLWLVPNNGVSMKGFTPIL